MRKHRQTYVPRRLITLSTSSLLFFIYLFFFFIVRRKAIHVMSRVEMIPAKGEETALKNDK